MIGPIIACVCGAFQCLIPYHNVLEYPDRWYEEQAARFLAGFPLVCSQGVNQAIFWSNFSLERVLVSSLYLICIGCLTNVVIQIVYFTIWTYYLRLYIYLVNWHNHEYNDCILNAMFNTAFLSCLAGTFLSNIFQLKASAL